MKSMVFDIVAFPIILFKKIRLKTRMLYLKTKGVVIGNDTYISPKAYIDLSSPKYIEIGKNCNIARNAMVLCHSGETKGGPLNLWKKYGGGRTYHKVTIGDNVFVGANSVILPGVHIGNNSIVGCNSVVSKNVESGSIVVGVPATEISTTKEMLRKKCDLFDEKDWNENFQ